MFPMDSMEAMAKFYEKDGNFCKGGIWSFLLSESAEESAEFAKYYYRIFNNASRSIWHLVICARCEREGDGFRWHSDENLYEFEKSIRASLEASGNKVPPLCIVFFDPEIRSESDQPCLIVGLDRSSITNTDLFKEVFARTYSNISNSFKNMGLGEFDKVPPSRVGEMILEIRTGLSNQRIISAVGPITFALFNALIGALAGRAIGS